MDVLPIVDVTGIGSTPFCPKKKWGNVKMQTKGFAVFAVGLVTMPLLVGAPAQAGGDVDYQGAFRGTVDSGGPMEQFSTSQCDTDGYSVGITIDGFT